MREMLLVTGLVFTSAQAGASGCGLEGNLRTTLIDEWVSEGSIGGNFELLKKSELTAVIRDRSTGKRYWLSWEKTVPFKDHALMVVQKRDLLFEEGNGCGPIFRCVTGQIRLLVGDSSTGRMEVYSFPTISEVSPYVPFEYVSPRLLPEFGQLRLDVPPLGDTNTDPIPANRQQCGYGDW